MFDNLQDKMDRVFKTLRGEAALNEWHIDNALKEIRVALLEADVHFKVVKEFTNRVREKAAGQEVLTAFSPAQQVTKVVRDELQTLLGGNEVGLALIGSPAVVMKRLARSRRKRHDAGRCPLDGMFRIGPRQFGAKEFRAPAGPLEHESNETKRKIVRLRRRAGEDGETRVACRARTKAIDRIGDDV